MTGYLIFPTEAIFSLNKMLGVTSAGIALLARGHQDSEEALVLFFLLISDGYTNYFSSASYDG